MTITAGYGGNLERPVCQVLTAGVVKIGDTVGKQTLALTSALLANDTAGAVQCKVYWYEASTTTQHMLATKLVAANSTDVVKDFAIRLSEGDEIRAVGAANVHITLTYMLSFPYSK